MTFLISIKNFRNLWHYRMVHCGSRSVRNQGRLLEKKNRLNGREFFDEHAKHKEYFKFLVITFNILNTPMSPPCPTYIYLHHIPYTHFKCDSISLLPLIRSAYGKMDWFLSTTKTVRYRWNIQERAVRRISKYKVFSLFLYLSKQFNY